MVEIPKVNQERIKKSEGRKTHVLLAQMVEEPWRHHSRAPKTRALGLSKQTLEAPKKKTRSKREAKRTGNSVSTPSWGRTTFSLFARLPLSLTSAVESKTYCSSPNELTQMTSLPSKIRRNNTLGYHELGVPGTSVRDSSDALRKMRGLGGPWVGKPSLFYSRIRVFHSDYLIFLWEISFSNKHQKKSKQSDKKQETTAHLSLAFSPFHLFTLCLTNAFLSLQKANR